MPKRRSPAPSAPLPAYALYGEQGRGGLGDVLHVESIAQRSRLHDWEIRPHRHDALYQVLVIARGDAEAHLDGAAVALQGPCAVTVPALAAHGFRFDTAIDGLVFTVDEPHLQRLLGGAPALRDALLALRALPLADGGVLQSAQALADEYARAGPWRGFAVDAALRTLLLALARAAPPAADGAAPRGRALAHLQRYRALVETRFREQPALAELARELGLTATQLNRVCRAVLGQSASQLLHARLLLEAQRELAYTNLSVKQVALGLGFCDAGYFARFFQRRTGRTPSAWRAGCAR